MKNTLAVLILCGLLTLTAPAGAHVHDKPPAAEKEKGGDQDSPPLPPYYGPKKRLAVADLEMKAGVTTTSNPTSSGGSTSTTSLDIPPPSDFGTGLTEILTTGLMKSNRFVLLERKSLADVTTEQTVSGGAAFDPNAAIKPGSLLGAQIMVRGAITTFSYSSSGSNNSGLSRYITGGFAKSKANVTLDIRLIDTATGQIIDSIDASGSVTSSAMHFDLTKGDAKIGTSSFNNSPLGLATRKAIASAVFQICTNEKLKGMVWEARIAEMDGLPGKPATLYLDAGTNSGLKKGDEFLVYHPGRAIISPETQIVIGRMQDVKLGRCRVDSLTDTLAIATVLEGDGFAKNDVVRFAPETVMTKGELK